MKTFDDSLQKKKRRRGWLHEVLDPEGNDPPGMHGLTKNTKEVHRRSEARRAIVKGVISGRKLGQMERLEWVTSKILAGWSHRKISYQFTLHFSMSRTAGKNYIEKVYKDFQAQWTDASKRNLILAEHCGCLKENASRAMARGNYDACERSLRQYAEVVGIVVPQSMIKFHTEDNRNQVINMGSEEMKATLSALEQLSEKDVFTRAGNLLESIPAGSIEEDANPSNGDVKEGTVSLLHRKEKGSIRRTASHIDKGKTP